MITLFLLACALAADGFAVSIARGAASDHSWKNAFVTGIAFGLTHVAMIALGWFVGDIIYDWKDVAPWIACVILCLLGGKMILEGCDNSSECETNQVSNNNAFALIGLLSASLATSLDGAAAGIALPLMGLSFALNAIVIGGVTTLLCVAGYRAGALIGARWGKYAESAGGVVLIVIGMNLIP
jgi:putative Mn2+ efflux pump MntP